MNKNVLIKKILVASPLALMSLFTYSTAKAVTPMGCQAKGALYVLKSGVQTLVATTPGAGTTAAASTQGHAGFKTNANGEFNLTIPNRVMTSGEQYYFRMEVHNSQYLAYGISGLYGNTFPTLPTNVTGQVMCASTAPSQNAGVKLGPVTPPSRFVQIATAAGNLPVTDCFKDTQTGLTWEGKPNGGARTIAKTNFDDVNRLQIPSAPPPPAYRNPTQAEIDASTNSIGYKTAVINSNLCGISNWRLPSLPEITALYSALGGHGSANMTMWLPHKKTWYQTATPKNNNSTQNDEHFVKGFNFADGMNNDHGRNLLYQMILVSP